MPNPPGGTRTDLTPQAYALARLSDRFAGTSFGATLANRTFSPGVPLIPTPPISEQTAGPRQFQFPVSVNTQTTPRSEYRDLTPFAQLRNLATLYDVSALCIRTIQNIITGLEWSIVAKDKKAQAAEQTICDDLTHWFAKPDRVNDFGTWLMPLLYDMLTLDAMTIYPHPDRGGGLWGLEYIDGATIKPLLDMRGQTAAYQQILYGTVWSDYERAGADVDDDAFPTFSREELLYKPRWTRSYTPYGFPPTEAVIVRVNTALRKQAFDLTHFTDSNIPAGILSPPDGLMQPEQVAAFEDWWNAKLQGDQLARQRIIFLPWKGDLQNLMELTEGGRYESALDDMLFKITCMAYDIPPQELGETADINKATGGMQQNALYRRCIIPTCQWLKRAVFDPALQELHGQRQLAWSWSFGESEDRALEATTDKVYFDAGAVSSDELRRLRYPDLDGPAPGKPAAAPAGGPDAAGPFEQLAKKAPEPPDAVARLKQEQRAKKIIADAYAAQQARIQAQLAADPHSLDWSREPTRMAEAVLPLYEATSAQAARQALTQIRATVAWEKVNQAALKLARQRAARFGDEVTATAKERTAARVADWVEKGGTLPELIASVSEVWSGPRADVAAATEVTDLYAQANRAAWQESGVVQAMTIRTTNDEAVCDVCGPLADTEVDFDGDIPPFHVGCRCWVVPIVRGPGEL